MLLLDNIKKRLQDAKKLFSDCIKALDESKLRGELSRLLQKQQDPGFYKNQKQLSEVSSEIKHIEKLLLTINQVSQILLDASEFVLLFSSDNAVLQDIDKDLLKAENILDSLYLDTLLTGEYDKHNAILSLHSGAGGTEAQDWVSMLYRMYKMYASDNGFLTQELDYLSGDEAGIKSVSFLVSGTNAYGYLKAEKGVHRLVRISPFDSNARRHTSFASLEVMPEIEQDSSIRLSPEELKIDTFRAGGAGGQHVNKTESAVRITHIPTGIVTTCQNERSQIQNKETALKMLLSKLVEKRERENQEKQGEISGQLKKIEWGSQIRSYVFQPYTMVKDHRTNFENTDVEGVMNGKIKEFIFEYLRKSISKP